MHELRQLVIWASPGVGDVQPTRKTAGCLKVEHEVQLSEQCFVTPIPVFSQARRKGVRIEVWSGQNSVRRPGGKSDRDSFLKRVLFVDFAGFRERKLYESEAMALNKRGPSSY